MEKRWTWLVLLIITLAAFAGCSDSDDPVTTPPATETAFEAMAKAGAAYVNTSECPGVISAANLQNDLDSYTVIDIRSAEAYGQGHIPGAYNSSLATLVNDLTSIPSNKPYVITCYSGQSAGHAKIAMELLGFGEIYSLKYGMCSWSDKTTASWDDNYDDLLTNPEVTNNNGDLVVYDFPVLDGSASTIVAERVALMLENNFQGISYKDIENNLDDYFILNYFGEADYLGQGTAGVPGHIPGAYQFTPGASLAMDQMLDNLPTDMPIVVYCWTSQTSSQIAAYLNMLGYEAYSLKFGANQLFHTSLTSHKWGDNEKNDFPMDEGYAPNAAFAAMAEAGATYVNGADCPGVIDAQDLYNDLADFTVIDIRSQDAYDDGHIVGAYKSSLGTLLADMESTIPTDKPIVLACYSGQSAGHAKIALELMGYGDVYSLLYGMASWSDRLDMQNSWTSKTDDTLTNPETANNNGDLTYHMYPELAGDAGTVVQTRVAAMLETGFQSVAYSDIQNNLEDYFVMNYFGEADYLGQGTAGVPGHIPGAFQFTPKASLAVDQMLANLPTDKPIVVYCWTGQHSSQITAYLNMLGYEAYSLRNGSNNLFYSDLLAHKWEVGVTTHSFPLHNDTVAVN